MSYPPVAVCTGGTESIQRFLCSGEGLHYGTRTHTCAHTHTRTLTRDYPVGLLIGIHVFAASSKLSTEQDHFFIQQGFKWRHNVRVASTNKD